MFRGTDAVNAATILFVLVAPDGIHRRCGVAAVVLPYTYAARSSQLSFCLLHYSCMQKRKSVLPRSKLDLLPLPRVEMDRLSLVSHLALADLSTGTGSMRSFAILANTVVLTHFLMGEGFGAAGDGREILERAKGAVNACDKAATLAGKWTVEGEDYRWLGRCLTLHDRQLRIAPRQAVAMAVIRRDAYWVEEEKRKSLKKAA